MSKPRVFYISPNIFNSYADKHNEIIVSSAGANKIEQVLEAINFVGISAWAVCVPVISEAKKRKYDFSLSRQKHIKILTFRAYRNRWLNRISAIFCYASFALTAVRKVDRVIFYNFFPEYIICAAILYFRGNQAFLDIEDAPRNYRDNLSFYDYLCHFSFIALRLLCKSRLIGASKNILEKCNSKDGIVIYGAVPEFSLLLGKSNLNKVNILYSGSKTVDWGVNLFCEALDEISEWPEIMRQRIIFQVTGFGQFSKIRECANRLSKKINIEIYENAPRSIYESLLKNANVGLELRLRESEGSKTTFPSKIVEFARLGKLIISTGTNEVLELLERDGCLMLQEVKSENLVLAIKSILDNQKIIYDIGEIGQKNIHNKLSYPVIGPTLKNFLEI